MTIVICDRHNIAWADLMRLLPSSTLGIAIGLFSLRRSIRARSRKRLAW
jgi:hypothetical protein